ncbi:hypothetical protein ACL9RF_03160 [Sphingobacterium sp. Mn56C]|uniref:hypothetical protein n=1 Tax=Sphingobacterium sp. Mn56C TaxID=3395261 RepID=UPI003BBA1EDE
MSWLKKMFTSYFRGDSWEDAVDGDSIDIERYLAHNAVVNSNVSRKRMRALAKARDLEEKELADQLVVVDGATVKIANHVGLFRVLRTVASTQGKATGTIADRKGANFVFRDGFEITAVLGNWQNYGSFLVQNNAVLLKKSTLKVMGKMPGNSPPETGCIEIIDPGQVHIPACIGAGEVIPAPEIEELDFDLQLEHIKADFMPFGIPDFVGDKENATINFKLTVRGKGIDQWLLKIEHRGQTIRHIFSSLKEVQPVTNVIMAAASTAAAGSAERKTVCRDFPAGTYIICWDGFNDDEVYSSKLLTHELGLTATIVAFGDEKMKDYTTAVFNYSYNTVQCVDIWIDNKTCMVEVALRVRLRDAGALGASFYAANKIPNKELIHGIPAIKVATHSFEDLRRFALEGINYHWGRNKIHKQGKYVKINNKPYEVYVRAKNRRKNVMTEIYLLYNTNNKVVASGNPVQVPEELEALYGKRGSWSVICFNVGYIEHEHGWDYHDVYETKLLFREIAAHEIGHDILAYYAGDAYSSSHKGTSDIDTQIINPDAPCRPATGEFDLMQYYQDTLSSKDLFRSVAAEEDVLGLLWLSKVKSV